MKPTRNYSRREFLSTAALGTCAAWLFPWAAWAREAAASTGSLVALSRYQAELGGSVLNILRTDGSGLLQVPLPLRLPHSALKRPANAEVLALDQNGGQAARVGLDGSWLGLTTLPAGEYFYGHGAYTADGKTVFTSEIGKREDGPGRISVRDAETLQKLGEFPSHGRAPHDVLLAPDGRSLWVANHGLFPGDTPRPLDSCVCRVELASGKLLERVELPHSNTFASHLALNANGDLVVSSRDYLKKQDKESRRIRSLLDDPLTREDGVRLLPKASYYRHSPVYFYSPGAGKARPSADFLLASDLRHNLSTAFDTGGGLAIVAHIEANLATVWDFASGVCLHAERFWQEQPMGVAPGFKPRSFWITTNAGNLYSLDLDQPDGRQLKATGLSYGLHLTVC